MPGPHHLKPAAPGLPDETWTAPTAAHRLRFFRLILAASLAISALLYLPLTWQWPLVGDASLIHYIAFLIQRGWAPYRQLGDMNMPGSFLVELGAMHLFGPGPHAWRLFDFTLLASAAAAFASICQRRNWLAALCAASLFTLIHGRDGLAQGGQRDLTIAVALLGSTAFLIIAVRRGSALHTSLFGLLSGLAVTLKPTAALLTILQLAITLHADRRPCRLRRYIVPAALGYLLAPAACLVFLLREHALGAFLTGLRTVVPYYASLGHRPLAYILAHSLSPIPALILIWLAVLVLQPRSARPANLEFVRRELVAGVAFGLLNCILQARALPYYRYPLLAFLLPLIALDLVRAAGFAPELHPASHPSPGSPTRRPLVPLLAWVALAYAGLVLAPQSAILIHRYRWWQLEMQSSLERTLHALGGRALSDHIQCIDSVSGCNTVLYRMRLEPATGVLSDFLLFGNSTDRLSPNQIPVIRDTRAAFATALLADPPKVIVVTSHLHMTGPDNFAKLARWPAFQQFLGTRYTLFTQWTPTRTERWWSREELPASYRVYVLRRVSQP